MVCDILSFICVAWSRTFLLLESALASPASLTSQDPSGGCRLSLQGVAGSPFHLRADGRPREVLIVYSLHLVQGRAWMLLLQPVLGREKSVGVGPPSRGSW